jgi:hypothetical protein
MGTVMSLIFKCKWFSTIQMLMGGYRQKYHSIKKRLYIVANFDE